MITDAVKAKILTAVARGETIASAARKNGISTPQARNALFRICRSLNLSPDISDISANSEKYLLAAHRKLQDPKIVLPQRLWRDLMQKLRLRSPDEITPRYFSNLTAEQMLDSGVTESSLSDIQEWLNHHGASLKRKAPNSSTASRSVKRAIYLLDSFGFDISRARVQFGKLDE